MGRFVTSEEVSKKHLATLKDLNWIQRKRKLKLGPEKATLLINQLRADCLFLAKVRIMDYSLLVGIHYTSRGNSDNIRGRSIKMLEPATPVGGSSNGGPTFKQSNFSAPVDGEITTLPSEYISFTFKLILGEQCVFFTTRMVDTGPRFLMENVAMKFISWE